MKLSYLCRLVLLPLVGFLVLYFSSPSDSAVSSESLSRVSPDSAVPSNPADGFTMTVQVWSNLEEQAREIQARLQKLFEESSAESAGDKTKFQSIFTKKLLESYPGSSFNGVTGMVKLPDLLAVRFNSAMKVESLKRIDPFKGTYLISQGRFFFSDAAGYVSGTVNKTVPTRSAFTNAHIPAIREEAEKIVTSQGSPWLPLDTAETAVLNDAYQLLSQTNPESMDMFAARVLKSQQMQEMVLNSARKGYRERHPGEFDETFVAPTATAATNNSLPKLRQRTDYGSIVSVLAVAALAVIVFLCMALVFRFVRSSISTKPANPYQDKYSLYSPMVIRHLKRAGNMLWGKNNLWHKKSHIHKSGNLWLLSDTKIESFDKNLSLVGNCLRVSLSETGFQIRIVRKGSKNEQLSFLCKDFSEAELKSELEKACTVLKST